MARKSWFGALVVLMAFSICFTTGCKRTPRNTRSSGGLDGTGGMLGENIDAEGSAFGARPGSDARYLADVLAEPVYFDYDSTQIRESERAKLEKVADYLKGQNARVAVIIEGNCDERGSAEYNMALGERRALAARAYLIGLGVDGALVQTRSLGKENPVDPGHDESAWRVNRRDEFQFVEQ